MPKYQLSDGDRFAMGQRFKAALQLSGIGVRTLAREMHCSTNSIYQWQHGWLPSAETRVRLAELLGQPEAKLWAEEYARLDALKEVLDAPSGCEAS